MAPCGKKVDESQRGSRQGGVKGRFGEMNNAARADAFILSFLLLFFLLFFLPLIIVILLLIIIIISTIILLQTTLHRTIHFVQQLRHIACAVIAQHHQRPVLLQIKPGFCRRPVPRTVVFGGAFAVDVVYLPAAGISARGRA